MPPPHAIPCGPNCGTGFCAPHCYHRGRVVEFPPPHHQPPHHHYPPPPHYPPHQHPPPHLPPPHYPPPQQPYPPPTHGVPPHMWR
ncbi:histidine-rich glycoprotein-like [Achroia grisella]|uniref:histidine-rich glycoprotein-like n=1 Tax=Achroia grisella TaxID=688607 RepID=UPI0027D2E525|nr:histidine-rich glycoprotein-like [Achroia grisella]